MMHADNKPPVLLKKLVWLIVIWTVSVLALGGVSMIFRALMTAAGLKASSYERHPGLVSGWRC